MFSIRGLPEFKNLTKLLSLLISDKDELPEEFLLALGNEGEEVKEIGLPIQSELAVRWSRIMSNGLGKESKELIMKKYPTPENFPSAIPPEMNPEMLASISEVCIRRDRRITSHQHTTGKIMTCLGKALTSILKGNINTKDLIEQVNDAAKLAGDMFHQDSTSRKFFALATTDQTVREAVRNEKPDKFLFGKDCAEKIKAAQSIKKTGAQIRAPGHTASKPHIPKKPNQGRNKNPGNWRGPPRNQHQPRGRGGHRQQLRRPYNPTQKDQRRQFQSRQPYQYKGTYQQ